MLGARAVLNVEVAPNADLPNDTCFGRGKTTRELRRALQDYSLQTWVNRLSHNIDEGRPRHSAQRWQELRVLSDI